MTHAATTRDILVQTERPAEARAFYESVLGFKIIQDDPAMCGLETGAFRLFIDPAPALGPVLEVETDDVPAMKERLLAAGCTVETEDPAIPRCYLRDPFGVIFNLRQS
jgi:catechol 2,3-dioxygenase-like lactoylglutathione lyase family enzyme